MEDKNLISVQKYAAKNKCSVYSVIKQVNLGQLPSLKKDGIVYIVNNVIEKNRTNEEHKMRRFEFSVDDKLIFKEIMNSCDYGTLCLSDEKVPYGVPLNFVWIDDAVVFHGASEGRKVEIISKNPNVFFNVVKPYSFIPSYFSNTKSACPATQFFASISLEGVAKVVTDLSIKAHFLNALMEKMQPEGEYEHIDSTNPIYTKALEKTALFKIDPLDVSVKIKAGQNLNNRAKEELKIYLQKRGTKMDLATIGLMDSFVTT